MVDGRGIPLDRVLAPANRHDSPLLDPALDKLADIGPLPDDITVHPDAGYDSQKTRDELQSRSLNGEIAHKGDKAPIQAGQRWHVERTNSWHKQLQPPPAVLRAQRGRHRRFLRPSRHHHHAPRLIREAWIPYRWDTRPSKRP
jgi:IS5 family transposase